MVSTQLTQKRLQWCVLMNMLLNFWVQFKMENLFTSYKCTSLSRNALSHEVI